LRFPLLLCFTLACAGTDTDDKSDTDLTDSEPVETDEPTDSEPTDSEPAETDEAAPTIAELLAGGATVQELLDAGHTPLAIYEADNSLLTTLYGSTYQGGYLFHLDTTTGGGLVSDPGATRDAYPWSGVRWSCFGDAADVTGADGTAVGTGEQNTNDLVAACPGEDTAASVCANLVLGGYDDWFLPSRDELLLMHTNLKSNNNQGNLHSNNYWSSTEVSTSSANYVFFATGSASSGDKVDPNRIRAVRAF
jgi:hypothetical protein